MQDNFHLLHRSVRHAQPDLSNTIQALCDQLKEYQAYEFHDGRSSYDLKHHVSIGRNPLFGSGSMGKDRVQMSIVEDFALVSGRIPNYAI